MSKVGNSDYLESVDQLSQQMQRLESSLASQLKAPKRERQFYKVAQSLVDFEPYFEWQQACIAKFSAIGHAKDAADEFLQFTETHQIKETALEELDKEEQQLTEQYKQAHDRYLRALGQNLVDNVQFVRREIINRQRAEIDKVDPNVSSNTTQSAWAFMQSMLQGQASEQNPQLVALDDLLKRPLNKNSIEGVLQDLNDLLNKMQENISQEDPLSVQWIEQNLKKIRLYQNEASELAQGQINEHELNVIKAAIDQVKQSREAIKASIQVVNLEMVNFSRQLDKDTQGVLGPKLQDAHAQMVAKIDTIEKDDIDLSQNQDYLDITQELDEQLSKRKHAHDQVKSFGDNVEVFFTWCQDNAAELRLHDNNVYSFMQESEQQDEFIEAYREYRLHKLLYDMENVQTLYGDIINQKIEEHLKQWAQSFPEELVPMNIGTERASQEKYWKIWAEKKAKELRGEFNKEVESLARHLREKPESVERRIRYCEPEQLANMYTQLLDRLRKDPTVDDYIQRARIAIERGITSRVQQSAHEYNAQSAELKAMLEARVEELRESYSRVEAAHQQILLANGQMAEQIEQATGKQPEFLEALNDQLISVEQQYDLVFEAIDGVPQEDLPDLYTLVHRSRHIQQLIEKKLDDLYQKNDALRLMHIALVGALENQSADYAQKLYQQYHINIDDIKNDQLLEHSKQYNNVLDSFLSEIQSDYKAFSIDKIKKFEQLRKYVLSNELFLESAGGESAYDKRLAEIFNRSLLAVFLDSGVENLEQLKSQFIQDREKWSKTRISIRDDYPSVLNEAIERYNNMRLERLITMYITNPQAFDFKEYVSEAENLNIKIYSPVCGYIGDPYIEKLTDEVNQFIFTQLTRYADGDERAIDHANLASTSYEKIIDAFKELYNFKPSYIMPHMALKKYDAQLYSQLKQFTIEMLKAVSIGRDFKVDELAQRYFGELLTTQEHLQSGKYFIDLREIEFNNLDSDLKHVVGDYHQRCFKFLIGKDGGQSVEKDSEESLLNDREKIQALCDIYRAGNLKINGKDMRLVEYCGKQKLAMDLDKKLSSLLNQQESPEFKEIQELIPRLKESVEKLIMSVDLEYDSDPIINEKDNYNALLLNTISRLLNEPKNADIFLQALEKRHSVLNKGFIDYTLLSATKDMMPEKYIEQFNTVIFNETIKNKSGLSEDEFNHYDQVKIGISDIMQQLSSYMINSTGVNDRFTQAIINEHNAKTDTIVKECIQNLDAKSMQEQLSKHQDDFAAKLNVRLIEKRCEDKAYNKNYPKIISFINENFSKPQTIDILEGLNIAVHSSSAISLGMLNLDLSDKNSQNNLAQSYYAKLSVAVKLAKSKDSFSNVSCLAEQKRVVLRAVLSQLTRIEKQVWLGSSDYKERTTRKAEAIRQKLFVEDGKDEAWLLKIAAAKDDKELLKVVDTMIASDAFSQHRDVRVGIFQKWSSSPTRSQKNLAETKNAVQKIGTVEKLNINPSPRPSSQD